VATVLQVQASVRAVERGSVLVAEIVAAETVVVTAEVVEVSVVVVQVQQVAVLVADVKHNIIRRIL
jgi:hypothetical protein